LATQIALPIPFEPVSEQIIQTPIRNTLPTFVSSLLIDHAIHEGATCSITLEPFTKESAVVTSCFHIFDRTAITEWLATHTTCPVCKQETRL
jgi:E3 ubiquitin-protein ligase ATL6/9/15/31/42/55